MRIAESEAGWYFTGLVCAEMRKSVTYRADIMINKQSTVTEAQCECGAGQGPTAHCKHVSSILYSILSIKDTGNILFEETCTQVTCKFLALVK